MNAHTTYRAYMIRLWQTADGGAWRVSAEDAQSGNRVQFTSLNGLVNFLAGERITETLLAPMATQDLVDGNRRTPHAAFTATLGTVNRIR